MAHPRKRRARRASPRRKRLTTAELRLLLRRMGVKEIVEILPPDIDLREVRARLPGTLRWTRNGVCLVESDSRPGFFHKVQFRRGRSSCSCEDYQKHRGRPCKHIQRAIKSGGRSQKAARDERPYSRARRRPPKRLIDPTGGKAEASLRACAQAKMPTRSRELLLAVCKLITGIERTVPRSRRRAKRAPGRGGRPMLPVALAAYAMIWKIANNLNYAELREQLGRDNNLRQLGWKRRRPPSVGALCAAFGDPAVTIALREVLVRTARVGRLIDDSVALDSTGLSKALVSNWLDKKLKGSKQDGQGVGDRPGNVWFKLHAVMGARTMLVSGALLTLNKHRGTADVSQLPQLLDFAVQAGSPKIGLADKIYNDIDNFAYAESLGIQLVIPPFVDAAQPAGPTPGKVSQMAAYRMYHKQPKLFDGFYKYRSKVEALFSAVKRKNWHFLRCRWRKSDVAERYPLKRRGESKARKRAREARDLTVAQSLAGAARTNEALSKLCAFNLRVLVRLELRHSDRVNFAADKAFRRIREIPYDDVA